MNSVTVSKKNKLLCIVCDMVRTWAYNVFICLSFDKIGQNNLGGLSNTPT